MADKVETGHPQAAAVIERLREAAVVVRDIGDELVDVHGRIEGLRAEIAGRDEVMAELTDHAKTHKRWESLLEDFKRGIVDRDELLAGTIGK